MSDEIIRSEFRLLTGLICILYSVCRHPGGSRNSRENTHQLDEIDDILKNIWGGNNRTIAEAVELLSTKQLPTDQNEFSRYNHFLFTILNNPFLLPGWEDCQADTINPDFDDLSQCSILRENLKSYVYDGR